MARIDSSEAVGFVFRGRRSSGSRPPLGDSWAGSATRSRAVVEASNHLHLTVDRDARLPARKMAGPGPQLVANAWPTTPGLPFAHPRRGRSHVTVPSSDEACGHTKSRAVGAVDNRKHATNVTGAV
jgi:hypothetical protein